MEKIAISRYVTKDFSTAEALKTLRTNLMFSGSDVKAVALTSFSDAAGKSTISLQLAISLAQAGKQVLLMDADLRKSVMASRLHIREKVEGLSHYLSGMANANEIIRETDIPGLYIIFAGARVPTAAELLGRPNFGKLIEALKNTFDYVIVDTAPVGLVIDCAVLAPATDGVIMVIDTTHNSYKFERRMQQQLEKSGAKILGVILNRVNLDVRYRYYGKACDYSSGYDEEIDGSHNKRR